MNLSTVLNFLKGKKTYIISGAVIIYGIGVQRHWWPSSEAINLIVGGAGLTTLRMAVASNDPQKILQAFLDQNPHLKPGAQGLMQGQDQKGPQN